MLTLDLIDRSGHVLASWQGEKELQTAVDRTYEEGDAFRIQGPAHLMACLDTGLAYSEVYLKNGIWTYRMPFGAERAAYAPMAFEGSRHVVMLREMDGEEIRQSRVISRNAHDQRGDTDAFPHAAANIETRGEACFAARNVIDGLHTNHGHGEWPYMSWGIGTREDAALTIDLGRTVAISEIRVLLRADFPHDSWFSALDLVLSGGEREHMDLVKTDRVQSLRAEHRASWVRVEQLVKADDPSPFPSIRQIEIIGRDLD